MCWAHPRGFVPAFHHHLNASIDASRPDVQRLPPARPASLPASSPGRGLDWTSLLHTRAWRRRCDLMRLDRAGMRSDSLFLNCSTTAPVPPRTCCLVGEEKSVCAGPHLIVFLKAHLFRSGMAQNGERLVDIWRMIIPPPPLLPLQKRHAHVSRCRTIKQHRQLFCLLMFSTSLLVRRENAPSPTPLMIMRCGATGRTISMTLSSAWDDPWTR